jgi:hypothetical protein
MARPIKNAKRRLSRHVSFRIDEAEFDSLNDDARLVGLSVNQLARQLTTKGGKKLVIETSRRNDPALLKRIDKIGHNLNQLVKNSHIFGRLDDSVSQLCFRIDGIITEALKDPRDDT